MANIDRLEGIAFSCLAALVAGFLMTQQSVPPTAQWYVWGLFVVVCGLCVSPPTTLTASDLAWAALPPSICLILMLVVRGALSVAINGAFAQVASFKLTPAEMIQIENLKRVALVYGIILLGTIPTIILAVVARGLMWRIIKSVWGANPTAVSRFEKVVNTILRIAAVLGGGVLIGHI